MKIYLSIALVVLYLFLDTNFIATANDVSFATALLHYNLLTRLLVSLGILALGFIRTKPTQKLIEKENESKEFDIFQQVAKIISAPIPIPSQASQVATALKKELDIECAFVAEYLQNDITLLSDVSGYGGCGIKQKFSPHAENLIPNSIDAILATFFLEKREFEIHDVKTPNGTLKGYFSALKKDEASKPIGIIVLLTTSDNDFSHILKSVSALVAFSISLHQRKVASEKFQEQIMQKDEVLKIPTNTVLQTIIEQEYHRHVRYGTELSLIVIEIDHVQNLKNIFNTEDILGLKKEFISIINKNIRSSDTFGKWTENRFAIVAPSVDFRGGKNFANKLQKVLLEARFPKVGRITCSYGVTALGKDDSIAAFRKRAEDALNAAIIKGGNAVDVKILL